MIAASSKAASQRRRSCTRGIIGEQKDKLVSTARDKKDELMSKVEDSATSSAATTGTASGQQSYGSGNAQAGESGSPFGANDREDRVTQLAAEEPQEDQGTGWQPNNT